MSPSSVSRWSPRMLLLASAGGILLTALVDWKIRPNVSLGLFYVLPILVAGMWLSRLQIVAVAALCTLLREAFSPSAWDADLAARTALVLIAFTGAGLFISELARNRQLAIEHGRHLEEQMRRREEAEAQLRVLVESSPAAILVADGDGTILQANESASRLLGLPEPPLQKRIDDYVPSMASVRLAEAAGPGFRTTLECLGRSEGGDVFLAHVWFSTYRTSGGPRLAAIILDASEQLRDREALGLSSMALTSRVVLGAVSHEVRNLAAAAAVVHANLARSSDVAANEDFRALGTLVSGLERIASAELKLASQNARGRADLGTVLDHLRIVLEPSLRESATTLCWNVPRALPRVWGDAGGLLQIFLNLTQNSLRALSGAGVRSLEIDAAVESDRVLVRFEDTGPGIPANVRLFQPFADGTTGAGLGLYTARSIARSYGGDLRFEPRPSGACFAVQLVVAS